MTIQATTITKAITAQNTFSNVLSIGSKKKISFSLYGTFVGTVVLQRKALGEADAAYTDIGTYTGPVEKVIDSVGPWIYRAGIKTGGFTSGTANIRLAF